jgi:putative Holliday junction resolvase
MSGQLGPAAKAAQAEAAALATLIPVPIETYDERLSTVTAQRALTAAGVRGPAGRQVIDKIAAAIFLQAYLDHRAGTA